MTRVVAVGIGADVGRSELYSIASYPHELNVIMAPDFSNLTAINVENHVVRAICGKLPYLYLSSTSVLPDALGHTLTPFCPVCCQFFLLFR